MCGTPRACPPYAYPIIRDDDKYLDMYSGVSKLLCGGKKVENNIDTEKEYHEGIRRIKDGNR